MMTSKALKFITTHSKAEKSNKKKMINCSEETHSKLSILSDFLGISIFQSTENIVDFFFEENREDIKALIDEKRRDIDKLLDI
ncbi:hypothetical protein MHTCC0001_31580 [Flavobacteriaceae bacterium MHTCC 0001]